MFRKISLEGLTERVWNEDRVETERTVSPTVIQEEETSVSGSENSSNSGKKK